MRIVHLSDLHICADHRIRNIRKVDLLLAGAVAMSADHIVITGDISHLGKEKDFEILRGLLKKHHLLDPGKVSLTIGNHDIFGGIHFADEILNFPGNCRRIRYENRVALFTEYFPELFEDTIYADTSDPFPYLKIIDRVAFIGLNSIAPYSWLKNPMASNGEIPSKQLAGFENLMSRKRISGTTKVILVHHHFGINGSEPRNILERIEHHTMKLRNRSKILKLFMNTGIDLVLHGHLHINDQYMIKGIRFVNGGASVEGEIRDMVNLNVIDIDENRMNIMSRLFSLPEQQTEEIYHAGPYIPIFAG